MPKMTLKEFKNGDVTWLVDGKECGLGFKADKSLALQRCPSCKKENYALNVMSGQCTWCPFNANNNE
jgi:predicted Zn-ribbon and HTH transcriptional regulator